VQSRELAANLPKAELRVVAGAGHNLMLENPGVSNELLRELLRQAAIRAGIVRADK